MSDYEFKLPDIGEGVVEGEVVQWHVSVGDSVSEDDPIVDVMTDKATVTIPSPVNGTIASLSGDVGDMVAVGSTLVQFGSADGASAPSPATEPEPETAAPAWTRQDVATEPAPTEIQEQTTPRRKTPFIPELP